MSLINQMLQDLDKRGTDVSGKEPMQTLVRAIPEEKKSRSPWLYIMATVLVCGLIVAWYAATQLSDQRTSPAASPAAAAPAVMAAPVAASAPATAVAAPTVASTATDATYIQAQQAPVPVAVTAPLPGPPAAFPVNELKLAFDLNTIPAALPEPEVIPKKAAAVTPLRQNADAAPPAGKKPAAEAQPAVLAAATPKTAPELPAPASLNNQVKEVTPAQRTENDYRRAVQMLQQQGNTPEVMHALEQVLQQDPRHANARQTLVGLLLQNKRSDDAMRRLQDGLNLDPNLPGLAMTLARLQVDKGDSRNAIDTLQRSLSYAEDRADYQAFYAALLQREGRHREASEHYLIALRKTPKNGLWWMGLGISLQADNRAPEALEAFNRAKASNTLSADLQAFVEQKISLLQR